MVKRLFLKGRFSKTLYPKRTNQPPETKSRGRLFTIRDELTWKLFARTTLDHRYPRWLAIKFTRKKGATQVWTTFDKEKNVFVINKIIFDENQRNAQSFRDALGLVKQAEEGARKLNAAKIETDFTIIPPRLAERLGYTMTAVIRRKTPLYKYEKKL